MIVFKETKFFVFTGTSTDATGQPVFVDRSIRSGVGIRSGLYSDPPRHTVAPDGVYFTARDGIYRTTGEEPVKVSDQLDPWFRGIDLPLAASLPANDGDYSLSSDSRYVYFRAGTRTFAYDIHTAVWTLHDLAIRDCSSTAAATRFATTGKVLTSSASLDDDNGSPIDWTYRSGASDLGVPERKLVKQVQVWGFGEVTLEVFTDYATTDPGQTVLALGTAPAVARAQQYRSRQGTFFSLGLSGSGPVSITRATFGVAERELTGAR